MQPALEGGALLDDKLLVENIAFDAARGLQQYPLTADRAHHVAADINLLGDNAARDAPRHTDHHGRATDFTMHLAIDLQLTFGF